MTDQTPTCPTCGIDLRYPTGLHVVDCPATQTDQTPTTEEVQSAATQCPDGITPAEWDAWLATYDRETATKVLDDLTAWLADLHAKHPAYTDYVPLVLLNIERFRADRIEAGDE